MPEQFTSVNFVVVGKRRTSIRLDPIFLDALRDIARRERRTVNDIVTEIDNNRGEINLSNAVRAYTLTYYKDLSNQQSGFENHSPSLISEAMNRQHAARFLR